MGVPSFIQLGDGRRWYAVHGVTETEIKAEVARVLRDAGFINPSRAKCFEDFVRKHVPAIISYLEESDMSIGGASRSLSQAVEAAIDPQEVAGTGIR